MLPSAGQQPFTQEEQADSPLFPTPPCSMAQEVPPPPAPATLTRHAHFLHTFLRLRTLEATPVGVDMKQWEANIRDTVFEVRSRLLQVPLNTHSVSGGNGPTIANSMGKAKQRIKKGVNPRECLTWTVIVDDHGPQTRLCGSQSTNQIYMLKVLNPMTLKYN